MNDRLTVGLVGCRAATEVVHLPVLASLPRSFVVTHCFDTDGALADRIAGRTGAAAVGLNELLSAVDVVVVASPVHLRARHLFAACRAGLRGVLVDLPIGLTSSEIRRASEIAARHGAVVEVNAFHRHDPAWQAVVADGAPIIDGAVALRVLAAIGPDDASIEAQTQAMPAPVFDADAIYTGISASAAIAGLTAPAPAARVLEHLRTAIVHDLPLIRDVLGPDVVVESVATIEDGLELTIRGAGGVVASLTTVRHRTPHHVWRVEVIGPSGVLSVDFPAPLFGTVGSRASTWTAAGRHEIDGFQESGHRSAWRCLHRRVAAGGPAGYSLDDALDDQLLVESACRAIGGGPVGGSPVGGSAASQVAVFGAGVFSPLHLCAATTRGRVRTVIARSLVTAEARAALVGAEPRLVDDPRSLDGVTAVVVASPPRAHAANALAALGRGVPVLVEKPFAATVGDAHAMAAEARRTRTRVVYGENWAYRPDLVEAARVAGEIDLTEVDVRATWMTPPWGDYQRPDYGGGVLFDSGAHAVELARMLLGRPQAETVSATLTAGPTGVDVLACVDVTFAGGRRAHLEIGWGGGPLSVVASGREFELQVAPVVTLKAGGADCVLPRVAGVGAFLVNDGIVGEHEALTGDGPVRCGADDGVAVIEIIAAAYLSARLVQPVALPFRGDVAATPFALWKGDEA